MNDEKLELPEEINLRENETVQKILGRSYISYIMSTMLGTIIAAIIVIVVINVYALSMILDLQGIFIQTAQFVLVINIVVITLFISLIILGFILGKPYCKGHKYILTNKRIILFKKFVIITRRDIEFEKLTDLLVLQGVVGRWLNYGDINPISSGVEMGLAQFIHSFRGVTDPYELKKVIQKITRGNN